MNLLDHLPQPLHNRATQAHHIYALFATVDTTPDTLQALCNALSQLSPLPAEMHVYHTGAAPAVPHGLVCALHNLADRAAAAALAAFASVPPCRSDSVNCFFVLYAS